MKAGGWSCTQIECWATSSMCSRVSGRTVPIFARRGFGREPQLDVRPLISERVALDDLQDAFERLVSDRGRYAKILVDCNS